MRNRLIWGFVAVLTYAALSTAFGQNNLVIPPDTNNRSSSLIRIAPTYIDARVLAAGVAETHTIPAGVNWVIFSSDCQPSFFARSGASVAVPAADVTNGTAGEMNPSAWRFFGETQISLIAPSACTVTMAFYK